MKRSNLLRWGIPAILCVLLAAVFLMPTLLTITNSFLPESEIMARYGAVFSGASDGHVSESVDLALLPDTFSLSQYLRALFRSPDYLLKYWNSVLLVVPIVFLQLGVAALSAYGFTRWRGKLRTVLLFFYTVLMLMPYQVTLVPNYLVSDWLNLLNTRWAIILPGAFAPFSVFLLTKFMRRIPYSIIEAAKLDGASEWQIFIRICLPQCRGALTAVAILVFIDHWNMVEQPLVLLRNAQMQPLSVYLSVINEKELGLAFAMAVLYMIPPLLLYLLGDKHLTEGIAHSGSVKG